MTRRTRSWIVLVLAIAAALALVPTMRILAEQLVADTPAIPLPRSATVEKDGVRVTIELERNPMPAGQPTWATATVVNIGADDVAWLHDGCAVAVNLWGSMQGATWRPGRTQVGVAANFKSAAFKQFGLKDGAIVVDFTPEKYINKKGSYGCADIGITETLPPGGSIVERTRWSGVAGLQLGPPPTGFVELTASARYFWREARGEPPDVTKALIDVPLPAWIENDVTAVLHPSEAIDVALLDPRLVDVLERRKIGNANEPIVQFDPTTGSWQIGLLDHGEQPRAHLVFVDGASGLQLGFLERPWNFDVDGFP